jgi:colicin import membrane protein
MLFSAWVFRSDAVNTKIMELVAGEGDNYGATEAPALGDPNSTNSQPLPPDAEPRTMEAVAAPTAPKPTDKPVPDFSKQIARVADRAEARKMKQYEKEQKAREEAERKAEEARAREEAKARQEVASNRMTKEEYDRRFPQKAGAARTSNSSIKAPKIDTKGILGGVAGGSTANTKGGAGGTAMTREEGDMLDAYFSLLYQRLREAHEKPTGLSDLLSAMAEYRIDGDGTISNVRIIRSSGSPEFDQSVLSAFRNVGSIGPRPDRGGPMIKKVLFKMRED